MILSFTCSVCFAPQKKSGRQDLNLRPLAPHASALAKLRHAPNNKYHNMDSFIKQTFFYP